MFFIKGDLQQNKKKETNIFLYLKSQQLEELLIN